MERASVLETNNLIGQTVNLYGWVNGRRDHGKIIFIDLRDRSGVAQVVFGPWTKDLYETANQLRSEWVIRIKGKVKERPEKMINPEIETGKISIPGFTERKNEKEYHASPQSFISCTRILK